VSGINAGADVKLSTTSTSIVQTEDTNSNTGFNLTGATNSSTEVTGSGSSASVVLTSSGEALSVAQISAGGGHVCALSESGKVYCWGGNGSGQVGDGTTGNSRSTPVQVLKGAAAAGDNDGTYLTNIKNISAGGMHTCALSNNNNIYCWGLNGSGRLGDGSTTTRSTPVKVLLGEAVVGDNDGTYLTNIKSVNAGVVHTCAVSNNDNIYCWGYNGQGGLGDNTITNRLTPVRVLKGAAAAGDNDGTYLTNIKNVGRIYNSTCSVSNNNHIYCWGDNYGGQLGDGSGVQRRSPVRVLRGTSDAGDNDGTYLTNIRSVISYFDFSCAVSNSDNLYCWGNTPDNTSGYTPRKILKGEATVGDHDGTYLSNINHIESTGTSCAISNAGNVYCWGRNYAGMLGINLADVWTIGGCESEDENGPYTYDCYVPVLVTTPSRVHGLNDTGYLTDVATISGGNGTYCAVKNDKSVNCWGANTTYQIGDGTGTERRYPVSVHGVNDSGYLSLAAAATYDTPGTYTSGAIDIGFNVVSWGNLSWTSSGTGTITIKARSSSTSDFSGATAWASCTNITSGQALSTGGCVTNGHAYIQYQASLSTADTSVTPSLDSVTIGYTAYSSSGNLISSIYNTEDATNVMGGITWTEDSTLPDGTTSTVSLRTAGTSGGIAGASWTDLTSASSGCSKSSGVVTCSASALPLAMRSSGSNQYFQYKLTLTSTGASTPTITNVTPVYVVNAPPSFNAGYGTNGVNVSQITSAGSDLGKIAINYSVRDTDTNAGTNSPGEITPSFEYSTDGGSNWTTIPTNDLEATDLNNKGVEQAGYTLHSATWNAATTLPSTYNVNMKIRVTADDNEAANNQTQATSGVFTLVP
jgi:alpha-tubulin suppressor-like RCC1 family protein